MPEPILTIESLKHANDLLRKAAESPDILAQIDGPLGRELSTSAANLQSARCNLAIGTVARLSRERRGTESEMASGKEELRRMRVRAESAELALGQAVMREQQLEQILAMVTAEVQRFRDNLEKCGVPSNGGTPGTSGQKRPADGDGVLASLKRIKMADRS